MDYKSNRKKKDVGVNDTGGIKHGEADTDKRNLTKMFWRDEGIR